MVQKVSACAWTRRFYAEGDHVAAVAAVLSNWHNVLRAINMASSKCWPWPEVLLKLTCVLAKLPTAKVETDGDRGDNQPSDVKAETSLPQTLVRIPNEAKPGNPNGNG